MARFDEVTRTQLSDLLVKKLVAEGGFMPIEDLLRHARRLGLDSQVARSLLGQDPRVILKPGQGMALLADPERLDSGLSPVSPDPESSLGISERSSATPPKRWFWNPNPQETRLETSAHSSVAGGPSVPVRESEIQRLPLSTRTRNALRRNGIRTIEQLRELTDEELLSIPNFGARSLEEVRRTVGPPAARTGYGVDGGEPASDAASPSETPPMRTAYLVEPSVLDRLRTVVDLNSLPLDFLHLAPRARNPLWYSGIRTVGQLLEKDVSELVAIRGVGVSCLTQLRHAVDKLARASAKAPARPLNRAGIVDGPHVGRTLSILGDRMARERKLDLGTLMGELKLAERTWTVLERRVGFAPKETLGRVGEVLGLTRERVRQIQAKAVTRICQRLWRFSPVLDTLERGMPTRSGRQASESLLGLAPDALIRDLESALTSAGWEGASYDNLRHLILLLRAAFDSSSSDFDERWPGLGFAVCMLAPPLAVHPGVAAELARRAAEEKERSRTWTYEELAEAVLRAGSGPLHWSELADRAEKLGHREQFNATALFNVLLGKPQKFVRTGPGSYGLREWGCRPADPYPDIMARVMTERGRPVTREELFARVDEVRRIKPSSLQMLADMHPRFYRSVEGTYGLRAWLAPREKQTLRTPRGLVEEGDSYDRVARAEARGYGVQRMVDQDRGFEATDTTSR